MLPVFINYQNTKKPTPAPARRPQICDLYAGQLNHGINLLALLPASSICSWVHLGTWAIAI
jgi:hypothetical protein